MKHAWARIAVFWQDLRDQRGSEAESQSTAADAAKILVPVITTTVLPIFGPISDALKTVPGAARAIHLIPLVLLVICVVTIQARRQKTKAAGLSVATTEAAFSYSYSKPVRLAAKACLLPLLLLACYEVYDATPNGLLARSSVSGYLCSVKGAPVSGAQIEVRDRLAA